MKVTYEVIKTDEGSSFRSLYLNQPVSELLWEYHYHAEVELVCVLEGNGSRHVGYHKSNFQDGDLVLIGSNVPHSGFGMNSADPHREFVVQILEDKFDLGLNNLQEFEKIKLLLQRAKYGILFNENTKKNIKRKLEILFELSGYQKFLHLLDIFCELSEVKDFKLLNNEIMPYQIIDKHKKRLELIFTIVENNYNRDIDIQEVADKSNLTLSAFCNFFKKTTQMTFTEFVNRYRINKACLLINQEKSYSEAGFEVGFNNVSYFNKTFRKYTGKSPSEFKNVRL